MSNMSEPQPEWDPTYSKWLVTRWSDQYQRYYWDHHDGQSWVFFAWAPVVASPSHQPIPYPSYQTSIDRPNTQQRDGFQDGYEVVRNPRNYFKIGRIFMINWSEPDGNTGRAFTKPARFVVVRPGNGFSVCLRISTYSQQGTTKPGIFPNQHAPVVLQGYEAVVYQGEDGLKERIEIKRENVEVDISPASRINFAKPYTIEHNVKVKNIGRVVGESVRRLEQHFAEFLGFQVVPKQPTEYADETDANEELTTRQYAYAYQH